MDTVKTMPDASNNSLRPAPALQLALASECARCGHPLPADATRLEGGPMLGCRACNPCIPTGPAS